MGELFINFKGYDVQATRREARAEGFEEGIEKGVQAFVRMSKRCGIAKETVANNVIEEYHISSEEAAEKVSRYWN